MSVPSGMLSEIANKIPRQVSDLRSHLQGAGMPDGQWPTDEYGVIADSLVESMNELMNTWITLWECTRNAGMLDVNNTPPGNKTKYDFQDRTEEVIGLMMEHKETLRENNASGS